jgi:hypothetical protein
MSVFHASSEDSTPGMGFRVGEYTVIGELGHGSMATVYLVRDRTGHELALKLFKESAGVSSTMLERFRREAEATKKLRRHPHILTVYATGQEGRVHYIAMEKVQGSTTFQDMVERETPNQRRILSVGVKIASALQYAHEHNIVHRDVKPSNIMMDEFGEPLLADFGVAELVDWPSCTVSGALTGTPMYMSPEQARAERVGPASDIYSLAVVLYEALTGSLPYDLPGTPNTGSVLEAVKTQKPIPPRRHNRHLSRDLEFVLLKALAKDPRERHADMKAFAADLASVADGRPVNARLLSPLYWTQHFLRRNRLLLSILLVGATAAVSAVAFYRGQVSFYEQARTIDLAMRRSVELRLDLLVSRPAPSTVITRAWSDIRAARQLMIEERWAEAWEGLNTAADLADAYLDRRTSLIARLEAARCAWVLDQPEEALRLYGLVREGEAASPAAAAMAAFESAALLTLRQAEGGEEPVVLESYPVPGEGPFPSFTRCLLRGMSPATLLQMVQQFPERFQNDALFAIALRELRDGNRDRYLEALRRCRKLSKPASEWPSPLALKFVQEEGAPP